MDLHELLWDCVDWICLSQDVDVWWASVVNTVMNLRVRKNSEFLDQVKNCQIRTKDCVAWSWLVGWLVGWLNGYGMDFNSPQRP